MVEPEFMKELCDKCHQPLFLDKTECKEFVERKTKQGFVVCRCCGTKN
ncbi:MAG: hypothetical protein V1915_01990 [Candidatus Bathyarchaeota archaeon]